MQYIDSENSYGKVKRNPSNEQIFFTTLRPELINDSGKQTERLINI